MMALDVMPFKGGPQMFIMVKEKVWKDRVGYVDNDEVPPLTINLFYCRKIFIKKYERKYIDDSFNNKTFTCHVVNAVMDGNGDTIVLGSFKTEYEAISYIKSLISLCHRMGGNGNGSSHVF
jgi:hypothetical protein